MVYSYMLSVVIEWLALLFYILEVLDLNFSLETSLAWLTFFLVFFNSISQMLE